MRQQWNGLCQLSFVLLAERDVFIQQSLWLGLLLFYPLWIEYKILCIKGKTGSHGHIFVTKKVKPALLYVRLMKRRNVRRKLFQSPHHQQTHILIWWMEQLQKSQNLIFHVLQVITFRCPVQFPVRVTLNTQHLILALGSLNFPEKYSDFCISWNL